jgi:hypothetical protein
MFGLTWIECRSSFLDLSMVSVALVRCPSRVGLRVQISGMIGFEDLVVEVRLDALEDQLLNALTAQMDCI